MGHKQRGSARATAVVFLATVAMAIMAGRAWGDIDPTPPPNPSDGDIAAADGRVDARIGQVGRLINEVADADHQLQQFDDETEAKREAANKALVDLQNARSVAAGACQRVTATKQGLAGAARDIAAAQRGFDGYAAQVYTQGGAMTSLAQTVISAGPDQALDRSELLARITRRQQDALDGMHRAQIEQGNRNADARAAAVAASTAESAAEQQKTTAEQSVAAAEAVAAGQQARRNSVEDRRNAAAAELDRERATLSGLQGQRAAYVAWGKREKAEEALLRAALAAIRRVAADAEARARAEQLSHGSTPHTMLNGNGNGSPTQIPHLLTPTPTGAGAVETVVDRAMAQVGVNYSWGGGDENGPTLGIHDGGEADRHGDYNKVGFDCSGLMVYSFAGVGIALPHYSGYQYTAGTQLPLSVRKRGDMLFWGPGGGHHVALYLGNGMMVEAPESGTVVRITPVRFDGIDPYIVRMIDS